jgi:hypothetical protein
MNAATLHPASETTRGAAARLDAMGWGSLFLMTGIVMLIPALPDGSWLVGLGLILIAVNAARAAYGLGADWLWLIVGGGALIAGIGAILGLDLPVFALVLIACGLAVIAGSLTRRGAGR